VTHQDTLLAPGFLPAASAVDALLEGSLPAADVVRLVELALFVARPYVQAELFADLADKLEEDGFSEVALILDHTSYCMRERLDGHR